jgi:hypothetical protein
MDIIEPHAKEELFWVWIPYSYVQSFSNAQSFVLFVQISPGSLSAFL